MESPQVGTSSHKAQKRKNSNMGAKNKQENHAVSSVHGPIYHVNLLMLFLCRGVFHGYAPFRLGKEIEEAEKFDDLVFEYTKNGKKIYRLLQAKHKLDEESRKITAHELLTKQKGDYNLKKYCKSYLSSKKSDLLKDGFIKDVIIFTNIDFDGNVTDGNKIRVERIEDEDDMLDVVMGNKKPQRYRISQDLATLEIMNEFSVDEVKDFLDHLVLAVNQPNEKELEIVIKEELGKELDLETKDAVYDELFVKMLKWFKDKESDRFFSSEEGVKFFEEAKRGISIWFDVRGPVGSFVGRVNQLDNLHTMLISKDTTTVMSQAVSVSGLGGIGKSELVRKYIQERSEYYDNKVVWINAENYQSLAESFQRLACDELGKSTQNVNGDEKNIKSIVKDVYKFFSKSKSLFVFDNAEKFKSQNEFDHGIDNFLLPHLTNNENKPHIIITSRNYKWPDHIKKLFLDVFTEEEAAKFIKDSLNIENNTQEKEIFELSKELQLFPLALQQAVSYIRVKNDQMKNVNSGFQICDYLEKFKEKAKELLNFEFPEDSDNKYTKTTYITWDVTLDAIRRKENGEDALEILNIISYLSPENIPVEILLNSALDEEKLGSAIELLRQHSMVNSEHSKLNVHRLVQHVTRIKLENQKKEEDTLRSVLKLFSKDNVSSKTVVHTVFAWIHSSRYRKLIEEYPYVSSYISNQLINSGKYEEAYLFGIKVLELFKTLPLDNPMIQVGLSATENNIAGALLNLGKYDIALKIFAKVLHYYQNISPELNDPAILKTRANIALTKAKQGKYDEALTHYEEILEINKKTLKENDPDTLSTKYDIAEIYLVQGKHDKALQKFIELQSIQNVTLKKNNPQRLKTESNIVMLLYQNHYDKALEKFQEILHIQQTFLEKDHPDILNTKARIAGVLLKQCKYNDAFEAYQEILTIELESLKTNHPDVLQTRYHLAEIQRLQSRYDNALKDFTEIFEQEKNTIGDNHPHTLTTQYSMAKTLGDQGKYTEALKIYEEVLKKREAILGKDHIDTLIVRNRIAVIFLKQGNYDKAFEMYEKLLADQNRILGEDHFETLTTKNYLGMVLYYKEKYDKALQTLQETLYVMQEKFPCHLDTLRVKNYVALLYLQHGHKNEALQIFREVLTSQEAVLGKDHHRITETKYYIANALSNQKKHYEALKVFQEVFEGFLKVFGAENEQTQEVSSKIQSLMSRPEVLVTVVKNNDFHMLENNLKRGRNVNSKDTKGFTVLHHAVDTGNADMVQFLLRNGADVNQITKKGYTPLHFAASKGFNEIVKILLQHASHSKLHEFINAKTTYGDATSLHIAAEKGFSETVTTLLKHGAIYNIKNKKGKTPLNLSNNPNVSNLLGLTAELFKDAENGNDCIIDKLNELEREKIEAVMKTRNNQRYTLIQVAGQKDKINAGKLLDILKTT